MPSIDVLIAFFAATAVFAYRPGPSALYAVARTIAGSKRADWQAALGIHILLGTTLGVFSFVARLVPVFVCLLFLSTPSVAGVPHAACDPFATLPQQVYRFNADLDGEQGSDVYVADRTGESTIVTSCDIPLLGPWDMQDTNKPLNTIVVVDVEGDGKDELIIGGPTGSSPLSGSITRLVGTQLVPSEDVSVRPASSLLVGETFACIDTSDDRQRSIVNYTYSYTTDKSKLYWNGSDNSTGVFTLPAQAVEAWQFRSAQCGNRIVMNREFAVNGYPLAVVLDTIKSHLAPASTVQLGINNSVLMTKSTEQLNDANDWIIPVEYYAGYEGPFSLLDKLKRAQKLTIGPHNHCVGSPLQPPKLIENGLIQLSVQPSQTSSCLQWFSVDFWLRPDFSIAAVMLNLWEP